MNAGTSCPQCGQLAVNIPTSTPSNLSKDDKLAFIRAKVRQLDELIRTVTEQRASLLTQQNTLQSPIQRIPEHVLAGIFEHACHSDDNGESANKDRHFLGILSVVCSSWRQTVKSMCHLWTSLTLHVNDKPIDKQLALLNFYLVNAGTLPIHLKVSVPRYATRSEESGSRISAHLVQLKDSVFGHAHRFEGMSLDFPASLWLESISEAFSNLKTLSVKFETECDGDDIEHAIDLKSLPCLSRFEAFIMPLLVHLPGNTMTVLSLTSIPINICYNILLDCPQLIEFHCRPTAESYSPENPVHLEGPIVFPRLRVFEWACYGAPFAIDLFRHIQLPVLETLGLNLVFSGIDPDDEQIIPNLLRRLPETLSTLQLNLPSEYENWESILVEAPRIKHLELVDCFEEDVQCICQLLEKVTEGSKVLLPALESMTVNGPSFDSVPKNPNFGAMPSLFAKMMKARGQVTQKGIRFKLQSGQGLDLIRVDTVIDKGEDEEIKVNLKLSKLF